MHITACLAGQKVDVEVGEDCRSLQALKEAIVKELPQLCVDGLDVSVDGRALDDDEGVVSLEDGACLDVSANSRSLSARALREAGREVSEAGLLAAARTGRAPLCTLYLDAGVPIDCSDDSGNTPLHLSCEEGRLSVVTLLLDRDTRVIDKPNDVGATPLLLSCRDGNESIATLLLDRGSRAINAQNTFGFAPLHAACRGGYLSLATMLLDRGAAINMQSFGCKTPLDLSCGAPRRALSVATLLLDRGCEFNLEEHKRDPCCPGEVLELLSERDAARAVTKDPSLEGPE